MKEHFYAVGGSLRRLDKAEDLLWQGDVEQAINLFAGCTSKRFINFLAYLRNHRHRIPEYGYLQKQGNRIRYCHCFFTGRTRWIHVHPQRKSGTPTPILRTTPSLDTIMKMMRLNTTMFMLPCGSLLTGISITALSTSTAHKTSIQYHGLTRQTQHL